MRRKVTGRVALGAVLPYIALIRNVQKVHFYILTERVEPAYSALSIEHMDFIMEFGFTNDEQWYNAAIAYRNAAVHDGWSIRPTYEGHESVERAATLEKDDFTIMILTRDPTTSDIGKWKYEASIHIWGPDGLAIKGCAFEL
jgi:hypothetical protein